MTVTPSGYALRVTPNLLRLLLLQLLPERPFWNARAPAALCRPDYCEDLEPATKHSISASR